MSTFWSESERAEIKKEAAKMVALHVILERNVDFMDTLSPAEVCGPLNITPGTLAKLPIPRITLAPGIVRYRKSDLKFYLETKTNRP